MQRQAERGSPEASNWLKAFRRLGRLLTVKVSF
jgi:hypothetical protein